MYGDDDRDDNASDLKRPRPRHPDRTLTNIEEETMRDHHPDMDILEEIAGTPDHHTDVPDQVEEANFGVGIILRSGCLDVHGMTPGSSADQSGTVAPGDEIWSVDGHESLSADRAKRLMVGRLGTYIKIGLRRYEGGEKMRQFSVELIRGPPEYVRLLSLCSKLERQVDAANLESSRLLQRTSASPPPHAVAELNSMVESYKDKLALAEDEILCLRDSGAQQEMLRDKLRVSEDEKKKSEEQCIKLKQELITIQSMVNSSTYLHNRIFELETELVHVKAQAEEDRRVHRNQISSKEGAILRQVQRISELESDAASGPAQQAVIRELQRLQAYAHHLEGMNQMPVTTLISSSPPPMHLASVATLPVGLASVSTLPRPMHSVVPRGVASVASLPMPRHATHTSMLRSQSPPPNVSDFSDPMSPGRALTPPRARSPVNVSTSPQGPMAYNLVSMQPQVMHPNCVALEHGQHLLATR